MKSKKGAFANSATGYGKRHNNNSHKSTNKLNKSSESSTAESNNKRREKLFGGADEKPKPEHDDDLNSGFGKYLRSNEGVEMMKIFVCANTLMVFFTMAWPLVKEQYIWLMEWLDGFKQY